LPFITEALTSASFYFVAMED